MRPRHRDADNLAAVESDVVLNGTVRVESVGDRAASAGRLVRLVDEEQDARHVEMLHGGGAYGEAVPDFHQSADCVAA